LKISSIHKIFVESSEWNQENLFCGWYDADLSEKGVEEAIQAAKVCILSSI
jgi:bisphosphoglycerate-dependent phosphoglycerate mutase